jgi:hypothetical protein
MASLSREETCLNLYVRDLFPVAVKNHGLHYSPSTKGRNPPNSAGFGGYRAIGRTHPEHLHLRDNDRLDRAAAKALRASDPPRCCDRESVGWCHPLRSKRRGPSAAGGRNRPDENTFDVSITEQKAICPDGKASTNCSKLTQEKSGKITYRFEFGSQCHSCPHKAPALRALRPIAQSPSEQVESVELFRQTFAWNRPVDAKFYIVPRCF